MVFFWMLGILPAYILQALPESSEIHAKKLEKKYQQCVSWKYPEVAYKFKAVIEEHGPKDKKVASYLFDIYQASFLLKARTTRKDRHQQIKNGMAKNQKELDRYLRERTENLNKEKIKFFESKVFKTMVKKFKCLP